jgi:hypothetical protein
MGKIYELGPFFIMVFFYLVSLWMQTRRID